MLIRKPRDWEIPAREATPEDVYLNRRRILAAGGLLGIEGLLAASDSGDHYPA